MIKKITLPLEKNVIGELKAGEQVLAKGIVYTARDQAHKRLVDLIKNNRKLPFNLKGGVIYYCGPTQTPPGKIIGSCGPTTSARMDNFTEPLLKKGLKGMIGKGRRSAQVKKAVKKYKAVYFIAPSGCGALLAERVIAKEIVAFSDLGPEAVFRLQIKNFPLIVAIDYRGRDIYTEV